MNQAQRYIIDGGRSDDVARQVAEWRNTHPHRVWCQRLKNTITPDACEKYVAKLNVEVLSARMRSPEMKRVISSYCRGCARFHETP